MKKKEKVTKKTEKLIKEDITELKKEKSFLKGFKNKMKDKFSPQSTFFIEMHHYNGTCSDFILKTQGHKFKYKGKVYIIDEEKKTFSNSTRLYKLRYHEGFCMPFSVVVSAQEMKEGIENLSHSDPEIDSVKTSYNPYILPDILKMEYAKGVIQGAAVSEIIKKLLILTVIILIELTAFFGATAYLSGWL